MRKCYERENEYMLSIQEGRHPSQHIPEHLGRSAPVPPSLDVTVRPKTVYGATTGRDRKHRREIAAAEAREVGLALSTLRSLSSTMMRTVRDTKLGLSHANSTLDCLAETLYNTGPASRRSSRSRPMTEYTARSGSSCLQRGNARQHHNC